MGKKKGKKARAPQPASFGKRIAAFLVDWYVGALMTALPVVAVALGTGREMTDQNIVGYDALWGVLAGALGVAAGVIYYVLVPMVFDGRTLGKRLFGLRVASGDGSPATPLQMVLRQFVGLMLVEQSAVGTSFVIQQLISIGFGGYAATVVMWTGMGLTLASFACVGIRRDRRAIHALISDTRVVAA